MYYYRTKIFFFFIMPPPPLSFFFFFNDTATTEIYTLSLHDALPIFSPRTSIRRFTLRNVARALAIASAGIDRKSTRLNSSHLVISYAVFCLKKKKNVNVTNFYNNITLNYLLLCDNEVSSTDSLSYSA